MRLREFNLATDYDSVIALWQASAPGVKVGRSDTRAELAKKIARDPDLFLVAEDDLGKLIGSVIGGYDGRRGMVYHLAVASEQRRQGLGKALMAELETRLRAKGCIRYYLLITPANLDVIDFYKNLGWDILPNTIMAKDLD